MNVGSLSAVADEFKCQRFGFLMERLWEQGAFDEVRSDEIKAGVKGKKAGERENREDGAAPHGGDGLIMKGKTNASLFKKTLEHERDFKVLSLPKQQKTE